MTSPLRPTDPRTLGPYRLTARLGEGGMGTVYLADDPAERQVAVKVIRPEYAFEEHFRARFRSEVNRARQVPPFCTAEVLDADPDHDPPYLVVEYVDGPSLAEVIADRGPLTGGNLHSVAVGVAAALAAIHGAGVIHRDLKPRNVLFALGAPKVIDFGIARALEPTSHHTRNEEMVGTLAYMAPERFDPATDRHLTPAADIFAWGAVVTYAGTGRTPFSGDIPTVTAARILTQPPVLDGLPEPLAGLVALALAKDPAERPTAHDLLDLLLSGGPGSPGALPMLPDVRRAAEAARQAPSEPAPPKSRRRRRRLVAGVAALTASLTLAGLVVELSGSSVTVTSGSTAVAVTPARQIVPGPAVVDSLALEGQWQTERDTTGSCRHNRGLVVTTTSEVRCGFGPDAIFPGDQTIRVSAVPAAGSCAAVYFRIVADAAYRVAICPASVALVVDAGDDGITPVASAVHATRAGVAHSITIAADPDEATVTVDGSTVLEAPLTQSALVNGKVTVGALAVHAGRVATVTFRDADLRSGDPASPPAYLTGDATIDARVRFLDEGTRSAIVQPADLLTGAAFCRRHQFAGGASRCSAAAVLDPGDLTVTLPVAAAFTVREYRAGHPSCMDAVTRAGRCSASRARFSQWADEHAPFPVRLTVRHGTIVEADELDLP